MTTAPQTMLISLNFSFGKSGGTDEELTKQICDQTGANKDDLTVKKRTLCKEATAPLKKLTNEWKARLRRFAPAFDIPSTFLCKPQNVAKAMALRDEYEPQLTVMKVSHLIERYEHWKELTKSKTRGAFKDEEFPTVAELEESVTWSMGIMPLSDGEAMRRIKDLGGDEIVEALVASQNDRVQRGVKAAMVEAYTKLMEPLQHMVDTLKKEKPIIRESLVENVRNVIAEIPGLNLPDDADLFRFAAEAEALLSALDTDALREFPVVRAETAAKAADIIASFGAVGLRRFSL